jgi:glycerate dehydrogenase
MMLIIIQMGYGEEDLLNGWYREVAENLERWLNGDELWRKMN